jgi:beta-lactamase regulating signal transducer with metallopeptidase domain
MTAILLLVKASILLALAAAVLRLAGSRASAATRHLVCAATVLALLLLPIASASLPGWTLRLPVSAAATTTATLVTDDVHGAAPRQLALDSSPAPLTATIAPRRQHDSIAAVARLPWPIVLLTIYVAGVVLLLTRLTLQWIAAARAVRSAVVIPDAAWHRLAATSAARLGVSRHVRLLRSTGETMPVAVGIVRPAIILPSIADTWSDDRREAVLLHELAHIARHDCLTQSLAAVVAALYWIHPGAWWIARRLRVEREIASDDAVLASGTKARDYATHLLELAYDLRADLAPVLAVSMANPRQLEGRMLAVLDGTRRRTAPPFSLRVAGIAMMTTALLVVATATTAAREDTSGEGVAPLPAAQRSLAQPPQPPQPPAPHASALPVPQTVPPSPPIPPSLQPGTWEVRRSSESVVHLRLGEGDGFYEFTIDLARLSGLAPSLVTRDGGQAGFSLRRDAGTFTFEGVFRGGVGAGTFTFMPNRTFADDMVKRGFDRPTDADLQSFAIADVGQAFLDELSAQGYAKPMLAEIVRAARHGVSASYLHDMGSLGYRAGRLETLVQLHDHGVTPEFARSLTQMGFGELSADDLRRARDHGLTPEYLQSLADLGYRPTDLGSAVTLRDHGVTPEYVRDLAAAGYDKIPSAEIVRLRDHGISGEYVRNLNATGYRNLTIEQLVQLRNHGLDSEYIKALAAAGYSRLPLDGLIQLRNHGVTPEYVRQFAAIGYTGLRVDDLVTLRNHGITADEAKQANARAGTRLSIEELADRANHGWQ